MDIGHMPWYIKAFLALGGAALIWKLIQGSVPRILAALLPIALKATDAFVALILAYPLLRWFVLGNKANFLATADALLDGLEAISNAVQARLKADLMTAAETTPSDPPSA